MRFSLLGQSMGVPDSGSCMDLGPHTRKRGAGFESAEKYCGFMGLAVY